MIKFIQKISFGFLATIFLLGSYNFPAFAHDVHDGEESDTISPPKLNIEPKADVPPMMKSSSWTKPNAEEKKDDDSDATKIEDMPEDEITEDQKLWKKYKDLADGSKSKKDHADKVADDSTSSPSEESDVEAATVDGDVGETAEADTEEVMPIGLKGILESYHNAQKNKGKMNSRSFGKLD